MKGLLAARGRMQEPMVLPNLGVQLNVACSGVKAWAQWGAGGDAVAAES